MSIEATPMGDYADLGDAWLGYQTARLRQRHLQLGRRACLDVDALLSRAAGAARAARPDTPAVRANLSSTEHLRRAMVEAIEHCARLGAPSLARIAEEVHADRTAP